MGELAQSCDEHFYMHFYMHVLKSCKDPHDFYKGSKDFQRELTAMAKARLQFTGWFEMSFWAVMLLKKDIVPDVEDCKVYPINLFHKANTVLTIRIMSFKVSPYSHFLITCNHSQYKQFPKFFHT